MGWRQRFIDLPTTGALVWSLSPLALTLVHCKGETASAPPPSLLHKDVPICSEWAGTTDGSVNALTRARVIGYFLRSPYSGGGYVKKGDLLFELDSSKFKAALDQAAAGVRRGRCAHSRALATISREIAEAIRSMSTTPQR